MADDLMRFSADLRDLANGLTPAGLRKVLDRVGVDAKDDAVEAARRDLGGDRSFSGWTRVGPLEARYTLHRSTPGLTVHRAPRLAGPWRVAEDGRNQGNASGFAGPGINRQTGMTARTKTGGLRKVRSVKSRRWNGRTAGMSTWSDAEDLMRRRTPDRLERALYDQFKRELGLGS